MLFRNRTKRYGLKIESVMMIMTNSREGPIADDLRQLRDEKRVFDSYNLIARD